MSVCKLHRPACATRERSLAAGCKPPSPARASRHFTIAGWCSLKRRATSTCSVDEHDSCAENASHHAAAGGLAARLVTMPLRASGFVGQPAAADPPPRPRPPRVSLFFSVSLSPSKRPRSVPLSKWQRGREWRSRRGGLRTGAEDAAERRGKSRGEAISRNKLKQKKRNSSHAPRRSTSRRPNGASDKARR